ncbi:MAG: Gfo/Idh/MocA family oxidoreductase [Lacrimispora sp.]|uniref:Gfo/Idh/MocA family protein n=1 Tax=Lacrimispora sp. TaxID=2719234 RepID=UPI0039E36224
MKEYRWATLGCGEIAKQLAENMKKQGRTLYGVGNRTHEKAVSFAKTYGVTKVYDRVQDMFVDEDLDIIYISTPHNTHIPYIKEALRNGKHVLCEKSVTLNSAELDEAVQIARDNRVVFGEAMTIYHMPLYKKLREIVRSGRLGPLRLIQMNFGSYKEYDEKNRFFNRNLAGGALLDIGVYAISFVRWFMTEAPDQITSQVKFAPTGVDEQAGILLMNECQEMASISLSLRAKQPKRGMVAFDKGYIEIYEYPRAHQAVITYTEDNSREVIEEGNTDDALLYEILDMERAVSGEADEMHLEYSQDVMRIMTKIRNDWDLKYPEEV